MKSVEPRFEATISRALRERLRIRGERSAQAGLDPRRLVVLDLASNRPGRLGQESGAWLSSTLRAWMKRDSGWGQVQLHYIRLADEPLSCARPAILRILQMSGDPGLLALQRAWPPDTPGVHRLALARLGVTLVLGTGNPLDLLARLTLGADLALLGPDPGTVRAGAARVIAQGLARIARSGDATVLQGAASEYDGYEGYEGSEDWLERAGFTRAGGDEGSWWIRKHGGRSSSPSQARGAGTRRALVIGAGLAGCAITHRLGRNGWELSLLEAEEAVARGASGQPALAEHPSLTPDDALLSRLTRRALLDARAGYDVGITRRTGRLQQVPEGAPVLDRMAGWSPDWVQVLDAREAGARLGWPLRRGGLWLPLAGHAEPRALCAVWAQAAAEQWFGSRVAKLTRGAAGWRALSADGEVLAEAPVVILSGAGRSLGLLESAWSDQPPGGLIPGWPAPLQRQDGRSARVRLPFAAPAGILGSAEGHVIPLGGNECLVGPRFDRLNPSSDTQARVPWIDPAGGAPIWGHPGQVLAVTGGSRVSTIDHLPLIGPIPDPWATRRQYAQLLRNDRLPIPVIDGLWIATALGGRGLLWSVLAAEMLACRLEAEPAAFEEDLLAAVDPARFIRRIARGTTGHGTTG